MSVSQAAFSKLIGGYGFDAYEDEALDAFNEVAHEIVDKSVQYGGNGGMDARVAMAPGMFNDKQLGGRVAMPPAYFGLTGGRVAMPGEYFGLSASPSTSSSAGTNPSMSQVTDSIVRPSLPETFHVGGTGVDLEKMFDSVFTALRRQSGGGKRITKDVRARAKVAFATLVNGIFVEVRKVATKAKTLTMKQLKRALKKI